DDSTEEERALVIRIDVDSVHMPSGLVVEQRQRFDLSTAGRQLPRLQVVEADDLARLDRVLQRPEGCFASGDPGREADDRFIAIDSERTDLPHSGLDIRGC